MPLPRPLLDALRDVCFWDGVSEAATIESLVKAHVARAYAEPKLLIDPQTGEHHHKPADRPYPPASTREVK